MTAISLASGLTEVTAFRGSPKYDGTKTDKQLPKIAETVLLRFGEEKQLQIHMLHCLPNSFVRYLQLEHVYKQEGTSVKER